METEGEQRECKIWCIVRTFAPVFSEPWGGGSSRPDGAGEQESEEELRQRGRDGKKKDNV